MSQTNFFNGDLLVNELNAGHDDGNDDHGEKRGFRDHDRSIVSVGVIKFGNNRRIGHDRHAGLQDEDLLHQRRNRGKGDQCCHQQWGEKKAAAEDAECFLAEAQLAPPSFV